jgi:hypothetical protein
MTPFSAALLRQRLDAVIHSIQSLRRLACRLSACPRRFREPPSSNLPSPNAIPRLSFDFIPTRYYFRFVQRDVTSLSRQFAHRIQKFDSSLELRPSFHVALHSIHCLHAVAPTPTLALRYRRSSHSSKLIPRVRLARLTPFFFFFFFYNPLSEPART